LEFAVDGGSSSVKTVLDRALTGPEREVVDSINLLRMFSISSSSGES
jgi:hypothetical protein